METIPERSRMAFQLLHFDENKVLSAPLVSLEYSITCATTGQSVLGWTPLALASTSNITITATQNDIINSSNNFETKVLTLSAERTTGTEHNAEYRWRVQNLLGVS